MGWMYHIAYYTNETQKSKILETIRKHNALLTSPSSPHVGETIIEIQVVEIAPLIGTYVTNPITGYSIKAYGPTWKKVIKSHPEIAFKKAIIFGNPGGGELTHDYFNQQGCWLHYMLDDDNLHHIHIVESIDELGHHLDESYELNTLVDPKSHSPL